MRNRTAVVRIRTTTKEDGSPRYLRKSSEFGFKDAEWARRDPDLAFLHDQPEFELAAFPVLQQDIHEHRSGGRGNGPESIAA